MEERKEKIVLTNGMEIEIENGASENCVQVMIHDLDEFKELHGKFTEANLECYKILNVDGLTCANISNKYLDQTIVKKIENGYLVSFYLEDVDMVNKRLVALECGQDVQDGAIADLGGIVDGMMERGES